MTDPIAAGLWGLLAGSALVVGAVAALVIRVPRQLVALVMAFGAGALVSALAFDLVDEAFRTGGTALFAAGIAGGALSYFAGARLIGRLTNSGGEADHSGGLAIALGALLDGFPSRWYSARPSSVAEVSAQAFAAGAIITTLADTLFPEAYEDGGDRVGLATALGFATAFLLSQT